MVIGVLALQGAFSEHLDVLAKLNIETRKVKKPEHLEGLAGLIIPGGESTTLGRLMTKYELFDPIKDLVQRGRLALFGTCAGMIIAASEVVGYDQPRLGVIDIAVRRNAYGRQIDSFEADLEVPAIGGPPVRAVFIRAPYIEMVGPGVEVLAEHDGHPVMARTERVLVASFHPELTTDYRVHEYFVQQIAGK
ncbi:MAG: pyridoxal 5'-phosphate synthase glutaminase subunit PdxT [Firmicutes bacterium]|nr:pyridoxal 5'-phosphate synthase glutaminase subunit PdxT [Bacillota bacterium]